MAVTLATLDYGVWSLVWGGLAQTTIAGGGQLIAARHSLRPLLGRRELSELFGFGAAASASACVNYLALNGDYFIVGRLMGASNLGLYRLAYMLMNISHTHAAGVISAVMFPAFAQAQRDAAAVRRGFLVVTRLTAMVAAPAMAIMGVAAPHLVAGVYGPQWAGAVAPLQILCAAGYFRALYHLGGVVAQSLVACTANCGVRSRMRWRSRQARRSDRSMDCAAWLRALPSRSSTCSSRRLTSS